MTKKTPDTLLGYNGQPPEHVAKDGRTIPAGDLVDQASQRYLAANPGLDESQRGTAWNNLEDARRRDWCEDTLDAINDAAAVATGQVDVAKTVATAGAQAADKLGKALIDAALTECKALAKPWHMMTEDDQRDVFERITSQVKEAVAVTIVDLATMGNAHVVCELEQITVKKGAKLVLTMPASELREDLLESVGMAVILVVGGTIGAHREIEAPAPESKQLDLLASAHLGNGVGGDGGPAGAADDGTVQHSDPDD